MLIPPNLQGLSRHADGERWLAMLPRTVAELADQWSLQLGPPYCDANVSYVAPALRGTERVVLKVQWPHEECEHEAEALRVWDGDGAVRLLAHDADRHALLLEPCSPGTCLALSPATDALAVVIGLLPRLWKPAQSPFKKLADEAREWAAGMHASWEAADKPCEASVVDAAVEFLGYLSGTQRESVLLHQDLHGGNILSAEREPWLVIDPKPLAGEREFAVAPIVRSFEFGHSRREVIHRLDRLCAELQLDRERSRRWAIAQTVAWAFDSGYEARHFETARWLLAAE